MACGMTTAFIPLTYASRRWVLGYAKMSKNAPRRLMHSLASNDTGLSFEDIALEENRTPLINKGFPNRERNTTLI
jgi:hypothetical protein